MSTKGQAPKPTGYLSYQNTTSIDQRLVDDLEASTRGIYNKARMLNQESQEQQHLINDIDDKFESAQASLRNETQNIHDTRIQQNGLCWMYGVIATEVAVILLILFVGL